MWIFTTYGFFSVVAHKDDANFVLVRARDKEHLTALKARFGGLLPYALTITPKADYRYRTFATRDAWTQIATVLAQEVDYTNFKSAVKDRKCIGAASLARTIDVLHSIWNTLHTFQQRSINK